MDYAKNAHSFKFVENNTIRGYAIARKALIGYKICPLFADYFLYSRGAI